MAQNRRGSRSIERPAEGSSVRLTAVEVLDKYGGSTYAFARLLDPQEDGAVRLAARAILDVSESRDDKVDQHRLARHVYVLYRRNRSEPENGPAAEHLRGLTLGQTSALGLALYGHHTYQEIADLMGIAPETSAEYLRLGLNALAGLPGGGPRLVASRESRTDDALRGDGLALTEPSVTYAR